MLVASGPHGARLAEASLRGLGGLWLLRVGPRVGEAGDRVHRGRERLSEGDEADEKAWLRAGTKASAELSAEPREGGHIPSADQSLRGVLAGLSGRCLAYRRERSRRTLPAAIGHYAEVPFGHRSQSGAARMARLITIQETAQQHGQRVLEVLYRLAMLAGKFPNSLLRYIYAGPGMAGS